FVYPDQPTAHFKAACVGFREDLWYHVNFSACHTEHGDEHNFFAELRYDRCSRNLIVETCTILEEPLDYFRSSCALCQVESKILHPNDVELRCGKDGHEKEIFRERCSWNGQKQEFFTRSDMLKTPFLLGGDGLRYRLD
uniref:DUF3615 domain-containing protein n=2 Tax=Triticum urartu TaxID=4572 RepID=A0A8R7PLX9_TRIUA